MARFFRGNEAGATPGYAIGVVILAVLLIGGVMLLKNINGQQTTVDKPVAVSTGQFKADDTKSDVKTTTTTSDNKQKNDQKPTATTESTKTTTTTSSVAATGDTSGSYTPEQLTATGPEDFVPAMIGLVLAGAAVYAGREYVRSRSAVKSALLQK